MIICSNLFLKIPARMIKLLAGHKRVLLKPKFKSRLTLTFDLATWLLFATYRLVILVMMIICANLFLNPTMHNKLMGRT